MRIKEASDVETLIEDQIPESASLEYKRQLDLGTAKERVEFLKDLTGMANGGGGTILFGLDEQKVSGESVAHSLEPLNDRSIGSRLENLVRDTVHPPLLWDYAFVDVDGGFVLAVAVESSPLGPYMIDTRKERRYYTRTLAGTAPMSEQQVRDAYALALRRAESRPEMWSDHDLPLRTPTSSEPWFCVSALPEAPFTEFLDLRKVRPSDLGEVPTTMLTYIHNDQVADLTPALRSLRPWVDGFYSSEPDAAGVPLHEIRLFRDGAAAVAQRVGQSRDHDVSLLRLARVTNAALLYLGWFWSQFDLRRIVEVRLDLRHLHGWTFTDQDGTSPNESGLIIDAPFNARVDEVTVSRSVLPAELQRSSVRHLLVMTFLDRIRQAVGERELAVPFRRGVLYDQGGGSVGFSVGTDVVIHNHPAMTDRGQICSDGSIVASTTGMTVAWFVDGVVIDQAGDAVAVVELAHGAGCPDDFVATEIDLVAAGRARETGLRQPLAPRKPASCPSPTGRWSTTHLSDLLSAD